MDSAASSSSSLNVMSTEIFKQDVHRDMAVAAPVINQSRGYTYTSKWTLHFAFNLLKS